MRDCQSTPTWARLGQYSFADTRLLLDFVWQLPIAALGHAQSLRVEEEVLGKAGSKDRMLVFEFAIIVQACLARAGKYGRLRGSEVQLIRNTCDLNR